MRTTLTLDDDVAAKLDREARRSGRSFKEVVNDLLRFALHAQRTRERRRPFKVEPRDMGLRAGLSYDNVSDLLEQIEGPLHR
ncbi:MAG: CopG family transcriptional regulator [Anaeromyxobacteraceae bacterium]